MPSCICPHFHRHHHNSADHAAAEDHAVGIVEHRRLPWRDAEKAVPQDHGVLVVHPDPADIRALEQVDDVLRVRVIDPHVG